MKLFLLLKVCTRRKRIPEKIITGSFLKICIYFFWQSWEPKALCVLVLIIHHTVILYMLVPHCNSVLLIHYTVVNYFSFPFYSYHSLTVILYILVPHRNSVLLIHYSKL